MDVQIEESWKQALAPEFSKPYFAQIVGFLKQEREQKRTIYPAGGRIFHAFTATPFDEVKVVILGQDPYHGPGQAHGLSFSVPDGVAAPPSLVNIFKELKDDLGTEYPKTNNLESWARQGVLLLNASLTVEAHKAMSHGKVGWHHFTDAVIHELSQKRKHLVFILWGKFAQSKEALIDTSKHLVLKAAHPSPLSAHNGFFGSHPFSQTNNYLIANHIKPIDWSLS